MLALSYRLVGKTVLSLILVGSTVTIAGASELSPEPQGTDGPPTPASGWQRQVCFGTSASEGNTDKSRTHLSFLADKKGSTNEWRIALEGVYAESEDERSAENAKGSLDYRHFVAERLYGLLRAQGLYDPVADIDYRIGAGPGVGYFIVKHAKVSVSVETGVSYFWESLDGRRNNYPVARLADRIEWNPADGLKVWQFAEYMPALGESGRNLVSAEAGMESLVRRRLGVQFKVSFRLDSDPARGKEEVDFTYSTSLTHRF